MYLYIINNICVHTSLFRRIMIKGYFWTFSVNDKTCVKVTCTKPITSLHKEASYFSYIQKDKYSSVPKTGTQLLKKNSIVSS